MLIFIFYIIILWVCVIVTPFYLKLNHIKLNKLLIFSLKKIKKKIKTEYFS